MAFQRRGSLWDIAGRTSDPEAALRNLLRRDELFTERLGSQVRELGLRCVDVDVTLSEDDLLSQLDAAFGH
jgi:hypothetical protein